ncbi:hypothetical protein RclHR1_11620002 [Rhizophagus clarus]|uniref:Uncharacterized protein n=1 Tax=Rhizophagus clarus TaxID=94130 RepID=A0A2Z6Q4W7_9GLOM|nr:hypothetical protein RclHR1_11620002 [Rhizophagus clarus]GES83346.1 hypothetical protein GLOIN_2v1489205 [Rhizophagus clarus]
MANNPKTLALLYGLFLYKKKDIIAIQEKLGIDGNAYQLVVPLNSELIGKTLADLYELLLELIGDLIPIQENLNIECDSVLEVEYQSNEDSMDISLRGIFNLVLVFGRGQDFFSRFGHSQMANPG